MSRTSWLRNWRTDSKRAPAKTPGRRQRQAFRPLLESLEDRCLLTAVFLDPTFDGDGIVTTNVGQPAYGGEQVNAVALQADGKIIAVGVTSTGTFQADYNKQDTAVVRYNTNGSLDNTFSGDGKTTTSFGPNIESTATDVALQSPSEPWGKCSAGIRSLASSTLNPQMPG